MRSLLRSPGFTLLAVLTLALGIGACTAIFSVVHAVLLRPLPFPEPERLVGVWSKSLRSGRTYAISAPDFVDLRARTDLFTALAAYGSGPAPLSAGSQATQAVTAWVSPEFFAALRVQPLLGRLPDAFEWQAGNAAVVAPRLAQRLFGEAGRALGQTLLCEGRPLQIVGVLPEFCRYPNGETEVWCPAVEFDPAASRSAHNWRGLGRLREGVSAAAANAALDALGRQLQTQYPESNANKTFATQPVLEHQIREHRATIWTLLGAVLLVLLIACANVANLLLARGVARQREFAVRVALGASPRRLLLRQLRESLLLALLAAVVGTLLGGWGVAALVALAPAGVPRLQEVGLDAPTLLGTIGLTLLASLLTGALPALRAARTDVVTGLKASGPGASGGRARARGALVVGQLAISLGLLCLAGLLLKSFWNLTRLDPGFRPERVAVMELNYPANTAVEAEEAQTFFAEIERRAQLLPGVKSTAFTRELPVGRGGVNGFYEIEGRPAPPAGSNAQNAVWRLVSPGYFSTLGIPLQRGRDFSPAQRRRGGETEVVINETLARRSWPQGDPLGQRIRIGLALDAPWMTIVGVVRDVAQDRLDEPIGEELYVVAAQFPRASTQLSLVARTEVAPESLFEPLRRLAAAIDARVPVQLQTAEMILGESLATPRFRAQLVALFAGLALAIALVGVGSVMAVIVAGRRSEVGIRLALGATARDVVLLMLGEGLRFVALGLAGGALLALLGGRLLRTQLFQVASFDPFVFLSVSALFALVATAACLLPALRAAGVRPTAALKAE
ncbi:MAG: ABC transporter permease [Verrucomicrobia bacterium]|nr:ABC transporter permease [Verrucomicrobiota bacterium]